MSVAILLEDFQEFKKGQQVTICHKTYVINDFNRNKIAVKTEKGIIWVPRDLLYFEIKKRGLMSPF